MKDLIAKGQWRDRTGHKLIHAAVVWESVPGTGIKEAKTLCGRVIDVGATIEAGRMDVNCLRCKWHHDF